MNQANPDQVELTVVIPAHNSGTVLTQTVATLVERLHGVASEILVVENGSTDDTAAIAASLAREVREPRVVALTSEQGMGHALRVGATRSRGRRVLLTADDLPFGLTDLDSADALGFEPVVVIGSKAHRDSVVERGSLRSISTWGFRVLRRLILGSRVGDSQGTILADGDWLRSRVARIDAPGFLFSTQLCDLAEAEGQTVVEVPVTFAGKKNASTVQLRDVWQMALGLIQIRRRRPTTTAQASR